MEEPKHKTIKVRFSTYRKLRKLTAENLETIVDLIDRLVDAEEERRKKKSKS